MASKRRKMRKPEQIVAKLQSADAMLNAGKDLAAVLQALEISAASADRSAQRLGPSRRAVSTPAESAARSGGWKSVLWAGGCLSARAQQQRLHESHPSRFRCAEGSQ